MSQVRIVLFVIASWLTLSAHAESTVAYIDKLINYRDQAYQADNQVVRNIVSLDGWGLVYIFSAQCPYCQRFSPVLTAVSEQYALPVYPYSADNQGLPGYPTPLTATDTILQLFYGNQPVLYPATFLVHLHSKRFVPLTRGMVDHATLQQTLQTILSDPQVTASLAR